MLDGHDWDAADRWVDDWHGDIEGRAAQANALSAQIAELSATASSDDGLITVTVGASGQLIDLRLDEGIRRHAAARTAREVLRTLARARATLADRVSTAVAETVGADSEVGKAVIASFAIRSGGSGDG